MRLEQLKNLKALLEANLSYNQIYDIPHLQATDFPNLEVLNLSYNKLSRSSLQALNQLSKLRVLDLSANGLRDLPQEFARYQALEELNLSANELESTDASIQSTFKYLGTLPHLKRLNLSHNKLQMFHSELINPETDFL